MRFSLPSATVSALFLAGSALAINGVDPVPLVFTSSMETVYTTVFTSSRTYATPIALSSFSSAEDPIKSRLMSWASYVSLMTEQHKIPVGIPKRHLNATSPVSRETATVSREFEPSITQSQTPDDCLVARR